MFAGRVLRVPKGYDVRPATDMVRQAIFNSLGQRILSARVLDLFAGTGSLSLECLSRGAAHVIAIEKSPRVAALIRTNAEALAVHDDRLEVWCEDVFVALQYFRTTQRSFDLVFADPPFGEKNIGYRSRSLAQALLDNEVLPQLVTGPDGLFILRQASRENVSIPSWWLETRLMRHGDSTIRFFKPRGC